MTFSPGPDFYAAAAQVVPLLLLALVFEVRLLTRVGSALREPPPKLMEILRDEPEVLFGTIYPDDDLDPAAELRSFYARKRAPLRRGVVLTLLIGVAFALAAEGVALAALVLDPPPDFLAVVVLGGCVLLIVALLVGIADAIWHEVGPL